MAIHHVRTILEDGYGLIVELQPGDGTRYSVILSPTRDGFILTTTGGMTDHPIIGTWDRGVSATLDGEPLSRNAWTATFLAWWAQTLALAPA
jgi:hypothetical protein